MSAERADRPVAAQTRRHIACPRCAGQLTFSRGQVPEIDACGFECCSLACEECTAVLGGIIDPYDDALLLAVVS